MNKGQTAQFMKIETYISYSYICNSSNLVGIQDFILSHFPICCYLIVITGIEYIHVIATSGLQVLL